MNIFDTIVKNYLELDEIHQVQEQEKESDKLDKPTFYYNVLKKSIMNPNKENHRYQY